MYKINLYFIRYKLPFHIMFFSVCLLAYAIAKPSLKSLLVDGLSIPQIFLYEAEPVLLNVAIIAFIVLELWHVVCKPRQTFLISLSDSISKSIELYDKETLDYYYDNIISVNQSSKIRYDNYRDIPFKRQKTVYAITGNWRAGKTTAAGYIINKLHDDDRVNLAGEYYHDTFNFGNIDESIGAFFGQIATMTHINEFRTLGIISTPEIELNASIGPLKMVRSINNSRSANHTRKVIYDKLSKQSTVYLVVIDDIDRLNEAEQLQWLRTIELLGKFEQRLIVIVPVNSHILEASIEKSIVSKKYLDKVLPNKVSIGVDVQYIKDLFKIDDDASDEIKIKFAKYIFSLAIRCSILEHQLFGRDEAQWIGAFNTNEISEIAHAINQSLSMEKRYDGFGTEHYKAVYGTNGEFELDTINKHKILFDRERKEGVEYQNSFIAMLAQHRFGAQGRRNGTSIENFAEESIKQLTNYADLRNYFSDVKFKHTKSISNIKSYESLPENEYGLWIDVIYPTIKNVSSDDSLRKHFTYNIIDKEVNELLKADEPQAEIRYLINLIRSGDSAI